MNWKLFNFCNEVNKKEAVSKVSFLTAESQRQRNKVYSTCKICASSSLRLFFGLMRQPFFNKNLKIKMANHQLNLLQLLSILQSPILQQAHWYLQHNYFRNLLGCRYFYFQLIECSEPSFLKQL